MYAKHSVFAAVCVFALLCGFVQAQGGTSALPSFLNRVLRRLQTSDEINEAHVQSANFDEFESPQAEFGSVDYTVSHSVTEGTMSEPSSVHHEQFETISYPVSDDAEALNVGNAEVQHEYEEEYAAGEDGALSQMLTSRASSMLVELQEIAASLPTDKNADELSAEEAENVSRFVGLFSKLLLTLAKASGKVLSKKAALGAVKLALPLKVGTAGAIALGATSKAKAVGAGALLTTGAKPLMKAGAVPAGKLAAVAGTTKIGLTGVGKKSAPAVKQAGSAVAPALLTSGNVAEGLKLALARNGFGPGILDASDLNSNSLLLILNNPQNVEQLDIRELVIEWLEKYNNTTVGQFITPEMLDAVLFPSDSNINSWIEAKTILFGLRTLL